MNIVLIVVLLRVLMMGMICVVSFFEYCMFRCLVILCIRVRSIGVVFLLLVFLLRKLVVVLICWVSVVCIVQQLDFDVLFEVDLLLRVKILIQVIRVFMFLIDLFLLCVMLVMEWKMMLVVIGILISIVSGLKKLLMLLEMVVLRVCRWFVG